MKKKLQTDCPRNDSSHRNYDTTSLMKTHTVAVPPNHIQIAVLIWVRHWPKNKYGLYMAHHLFSNQQFFHWRQCSYFREHRAMLQFTHYIELSTKSALSQQALNFKDSKDFVNMSDPFLLVWTFSYNDSFFLSTSHIQW